MVKRQVLILRIISVGTDQPQASELAVFTFIFSASQVVINPANNNESAFLTDC